MSFEIRESLIDDSKKNVSHFLKETLSEIYANTLDEVILYIGYPLVSHGDELQKIDALLIGREIGVFLFSLLENVTEDILSQEEYRQKELKRYFSKKFMESEEFFDEDTGGVNITVNLISFTLSTNKDQLGSLNKKELFGLKTTQRIPYAFDKTGLASLINDKRKNLTDHRYKLSLSLIQDLIKLKPQKSRTITKKGSLGDKLNASEKEIANLDATQEKAIISFFDGVQRIRGLAGSGKTIVLAMKVATYHMVKPNAKIAVTFHSRSLKQQFRDKIEEFYISKRSKKPDWSKIDIIHAWGSKKEGGIYYNTATKFGFDTHNYSESIALANQNNITSGFDAICRKLLDNINQYEAQGNQIIGQYDVMFIDEAQDLPESFLSLCYKVLIPIKDSGNKRLIYAYDELQQLDEGASLGDPERLFGERFTDKDKQDLILSKCYRNSKELIISAHGLGFGIYRKAQDVNGTQLVQFFDDPELWNDIGYKTSSQLQGGNEVTLYRDNETSPEYFNQLYSSDELIKFNQFSSLEDEADYVANSIENDIKHEDLLSSDILVIYVSDWKTSNKLNGRISEKLFEKGIKTYFAGADSPDIFSVTNAVTITGVYRAKGNEVGKVYIIGAENSYKGEINDSFDLKKKRNALFVSMTRSKGTVEVCGSGNDFIKLREEFDEIKSKGYQLKFTYPTKEQIEKINKVYRSIDGLKTEGIASEIKGAYDFIGIIKRIQDGEMGIEDYPQDIQPLLRKIIEL